MGFSSSWLAAAGLAVGLLSGCADGEPTRIEAEQCVYEVGLWSFEVPRGEGSCPPVKNVTDPIGDTTIVAPPDPDTHVVGKIEAVPTMGEAPMIEPEVLPPPPPPEPTEHVKMGKIAAPPPTEHVKMGDVAAVQDVPCDDPQPGVAVTPAGSPPEPGPRRL